MVPELISAAALNVLDAFIALKNSWKFGVRCKPKLQSGKLMLDFIEVNDAQ